MSEDVQHILESGAARADEALERLLPPVTAEPHSIHRAMRHSVFAGGKRLRPTLAMEAARCVWHKFPRGAAELGAALEMIHTYSLIHDDLPALDNDDLRRGQPTCHVAFGEATAILAGDALQTLAFQTIAGLPAPATTVVAILGELASAIGTGIGPEPGSNGPEVLPPGMIGGQVLDLESEGHAPTVDSVERIHRAKTGALITASLVCGGLLGVGDCLRSQDCVDKLPCPAEDVVARMRSFGEQAGLAFQIVDDILDVTQSSEQLGKTAGKDTASDKATWPAAVGVEQARHDAEALIEDAFAVLAPFGEMATPLKAIARYLVDRSH